MKHLVLNLRTKGGSPASPWSWFVASTLVFVTLSSGPERAESAVFPDACAEISWARELPSAPGMMYAKGFVRVGAKPVAEALAVAQDVARAELARQLSSRVSAQTSVFSESNRSGSNADATTRLTEKIEVSAGQARIRGIEIAGHCFDEAVDTLFALARLDVARAADVLWREIGTLNRELAAAWYARPADSGSDVDWLASARRLLAERKLAETQYRALTGENATISAEAGDIERMLSRAARQLRVSIVPRNDRARTIEPYLTRTIADAGWTVKPDGLAEVVAGYSVETEYLWQAGFHFVYATGEIVLVDADGNLLHRQTVREKGGSATSARAAEALAIRKVGEQLGTFVAQRLAVGQ